MASLASGDGPGGLGGDGLGPGGLGDGLGPGGLGDGLGPGFGMQWYTMQSVENSTAAIVQF